MNLRGPGRLCLQGATDQATVGKLKGLNNHVKPRFSAPTEQGLSGHRRTRGGPGVRTHYHSGPSTGRQGAARSALRRRSRRWAGVSSPQGPATFTIPSCFHVLGAENTPAEWAWLWPQLSTAITMETLRTSGDTGKEGLKSASSHTLVPQPVNDLRENLCMTFNAVHALTVQGERLRTKSAASGRIQVWFIDLAWNSLHGLEVMGRPCSRTQLCWETTGEQHPQLCARAP